MSQYPIFITYQLAVNFDVICKDLEYDLAWGEAQELYAEFEDGVFDVDTKSEYDAIVDFMYDKQQKLKAIKLAKEEEERKSKLIGNRTVRVMATRTYYKYVELEVEVPKRISGGDLEDYLSNSKSIERELEDLLANSSLNGGEGETEYTDTFNSVGGLLKI